MKLLPHPADRAGLCVTIVAVLALPMVSIAQTPPAETGAAQAKNTHRVMETVHLKHVSTQHDFNDVQNAIRNMVSDAAVYGSAVQNAISIRATPEDMETAKRLIAEFDQPHKAYRITYTITEFDNGRRTGAHRVAVVVVAGDRSYLKHGDRVPLVTGMFGKESAEQSSQVQYIDVGLNIEATLEGDRLRSKVEQSSVSEEKSGIGIQDPIVRQTTIESTSDMTAGKALVIGSLDIPGTTRRQEIEAVAEPVQ